jgi:hypothetical protein
VSAPLVVSEPERFGPPGAAELLIEVPHGATERADFERLRARLRGPLPAGLAAYFHVNTDEGAPELARQVAARLGRAGHRVLVLRCRIPRTFIDVNRVVDESVDPGMSAGLPAYIGDPGDRELLLAAHRRYSEHAAEAYREACAGGGLALALHTYAPRSVEVAVDASIVAALRRAYRPQSYARWRVRPPVDLITETPNGENLAPAALVERLRAALAAAGIAWAENASYRLHPATTGHRHARAYPGSVLCVEVRRDLLGAPWRPFVESRIGPRKAARIAVLLAAAVAAELRAPAP